MRRYAIMQKARDADVFGLLVGNVNLGPSSPQPLIASIRGKGKLKRPPICSSLPLLPTRARLSAGSLPLLHHLRSLLRKHHKKAYTVSVGKLNPAKLANFAEVECFVLVACGENTLVDSKVSGLISTPSARASHSRPSTSRVSSPSPCCRCNAKAPPPPDRSDTVLPSTSQGQANRRSPPVAARQRQRWAPTTRGVQRRPTSLPFSYHLALSCRGRGGRGRSRGWSPFSPRLSPLVGTVWFTRAPT